jgi:hypothetical protein
MALNDVHSQTGMGNAHALLLMLATLARHDGVGVPALERVTGLAEQSLVRIIKEARDQFGVNIAWRGDSTLPHGGEFLVEDWGVFDRRKVLQYIGPTCML